MNYVQTNTEYSENVIYEDEEDKIENNKNTIFIEADEEDDTTSTKKGNVLMGHILNKLNKNIGMIFSIITMIFLYYFIVFESIIPIYESEMTKNSLKLNNKIKKNPISLSNIFDSNRAINYLVIFHFFYIMYAIGFLKVALYDPGSYHEDYVKLYSLKKYAIMYSNFVYRILFPPSKNKKDDNSPKSTIDNINYPFIQLKSKEVLKKQEKMKQ